MRWQRSAQTLRATSKGTGECSAVVARWRHRGLSGGAVTGGQLPRRYESSAAMREMGEDRRRFRGCAGLAALRETRPLMRY